MAIDCGLGPSQNEGVPPRQHVRAACTHTAHTPAEREKLEGSATHTGHALLAIIPQVRTRRYAHPPPLPTPGHLSLVPTHWRRVQRRRRRRWLIRAAAPSFVGRGSPAGRKHRGLIIWWSSTAAKAATYHQWALYWWQESPPHGADGLLVTLLMSRRLLSLDDLPLV
jgi:hypothetical protein